MSVHPLLSIDDVSMQFGGVRALDGVTFSVQPGEIVGLIGPNGAGKSTLFNVISGVTRPTGGEVHFSGTRIDGRSPDIICRRGVARTFQSASLLAGMTCWENVHVASLFCRDTETPADRRTADALAMCGLTDRADAPVEAITTGEAKRLEIARAIATQPRLLMTDEAVAGLNPAETDQVVGILRKLNAAGVTIMFVEHDMRAVMSLVQRIVVLAQGRLLAEGSPQDIAQSPIVIEAYLGTRYAQRR